jgi:hypothetical protein
MLQCRTRLPQNRCMGSIAARNNAMKTCWRDLSARARLGECFGFIDALVIFYKAGHISKELAVEMLDRRVSMSELAEYKRVRQVDPIT